MAKHKLLTVVCLPLLIFYLYLGISILYKFGQYVGNIFNIGC